MSSNETSEFDGVSNLPSISSVSDISDEPVDIFPLPQVPNKFEDAIPVSRWTKPSFMERNFGTRKEQHFFFNYVPEPLSPFELNIGNLHYRWVDGFWFNLGTDYEAACVDMTEKKKEEYLEENEKLKSEIEILLDLNTNYELKKAHLREKLEKLENMIKSYPGVLDNDSDSI